MFVMSDKTGLSPCITSFIVSLGLVWSGLVWSGLAWVVYCISSKNSSMLLKVNM